MDTKGYQDVTSQTRRKRLAFFFSSLPIFLALLLHLTVFLASLLFSEWMALSTANRYWVQLLITPFPYLLILLVNLEILQSSKIKRYGLAFIVSFCTSLVLLFEYGSISTLLDLVWSS